MQIGERLEQVELQLRRARETRDAILLLLKLNKVSFRISFVIERPFSKSVLKIHKRPSDSAQGESVEMPKENHAELAASLRRLSMISRELSTLPRAQKAKGQVDALCEQVEKLLLDHFEEANRDREVCCLCSSFPFLIPLVLSPFFFVAVFID